MPDPVLRVNEITNQLILLDGVPPGLNLTDPVTDLTAQESPEAYGLDMSQDKRIGKATIPAGTTRVEPTGTGTAATYNWYYLRLWKILNTTNLNFYAPHYTDRLITHGGTLSLIEFNDDAGSIIEFLPFGKDNMFVVKATGGWVVSNCADLRAFFFKGPMMQEMQCANAARITELDGAIYVSNAKGMFASNGGASVEITRKVRNNITNFASLALTVDYEKKRIIAKNGAGTSGFVYELETKKIFEYRTSGFRVTSRAFHLPNYGTFAVPSLRFDVERGTTNNGWLDYQIKLGDESWSRVERMELPYEGSASTTVKEDVDNVGDAKKFQLRITNMSTLVYIKRVRLVLEDNGEDTEAV